MTRIQTKTYTIEQYQKTLRCFGCVQENQFCDDASCKVTRYRVKKGNNHLQWGLETIQEAEEFIESHAKNYKLKEGKEWE